MPKGKSLTIDGITRAVNDWSALSRVPSGIIHGRLRSGWSVEEAVYSPVSTKPRRKREEPLEEVTVYTNYRLRVLKPNDIKE